MKKYLFLAAFVCLASCATVKSTQFSGSQPAELKVISYNVRNSKAKDGDNSWQYHRPATIAMLQEQRPDIFGVPYISDHYPIAAVLYF